MRELILVFAVFILSSCDCWQSTRGIVVDWTTNEVMDRVKVEVYTKGNLTSVHYTDSTGYFDVCTSNTGRCDDYLTVIFSKEGYNSQVFKNPDFETNVILIP